jgi:RNA polymerase sigma-70 factor (ECF subfamily)
LSEGHYPVRFIAQFGMARLYFPARTPRHGGRGHTVELFAFDKEYVGRLRAGDAATEAHFVAYFDQLLRILLRARMLPPDKVEDVTQETFRRVLAAVRSEGAIRHPERFGAFVNSICKNALHERERSGKRAEPLDEAHYEMPDKAPDAHDVLITQESREQVRRVLAELPTRDRDLLRELFFLEKDKDQICRERGVDREYLRVLLHRAKTRFRMEFVMRAVPKRPQSVGKQKA